MTSRAVARSWSFAALALSLFVLNTACDDSKSIPADGDIDTAETADGDTETADGDTETADGDTETADGDTETADGDTETADGDTETADGDTEAADGDTEAADGDTEAEDGDTETADGDTEAEDGDAEAEDGDTETTDGDTEAEDGDTEAEDGDEETTEDDTEEAPVDETAPVVTAFSLVENADCVLTALLDVTTDEPATVSVEVWVGENRLWTVSTQPDLATETTLPILGLHAETAYNFHIVVTDAAGNAATRDEQYLTGALPADLPPVELTIADTTGRTQPGYTLFNVFRSGPGVGTVWGYLVIIDADGVPVWYHATQGQVIDARRLPNGNILYQMDNLGITREIDMLGNEVRVWRAADMGLDSFHHEIFPMPNGNFLTLSSELRTLGGYTDGDGNPVEYNVVGDVIVEFAPEGTVLHTWSTFDYFDPHVLNPGFNATFWNATYPQAVGGTKDWTHGNAVVYDPGDDSFLVSFRHLSLVVKFRRDTGALVWSLGEHGTLTMQGEGDWQYFQHAPEIEENGNILLFDNGNNRTSLAPGESPYSRAVEYAVDATDADPANWTVRQVWEFRDDTPFYSQFICDADMQPNGNVIVTDGGRTDPGTNLRFGRIVEVTRTNPPEKLWEVRVASPTVGYSIYRSERIDSLYP